MPSLLQASAQHFLMVGVDVVLIASILDFLVYSRKKLVAQAPEEKALLAKALMELAY